jgi:hypothetical protein
MLIILYCPRLKPPGGILRANSSLSIADQYQYEKQMRSASTLFRIETLLFPFLFSLFSMVKYSAPHTRHTIRHGSLLIFPELKAPRWVRIIVSQRDHRCNSVATGPGGIARS